MILTLTNPNTGRKWKIAPSENGLDFQIFKEQTKKGTKSKSGKTIKSEWVFVGKYPSTLTHAVELTLGLMLSDPEDKTEVELDAINTRTLNKIYKQLFVTFMEGIDVSIRKKRSAQKKAEEKKTSSQSN